MTKVSFFILLACMMSSCRNDTEKLIVGDWVSIQKTPSGGLDIPPLPGPLTTYGLEFFSNGKCDFKPGFFDLEKFNDEGDGYTPYLGTETDYTIYGDSIKIFDSIEKKWNGLKIRSLTKDSLIMGRENNWTTYVKEHYKVENVPGFDAVIVSASSCYGRCPINNIMIDKDGNVFYNGINFNSKNGYYTSKISNTEFNKIERRFKKGNYINLEKDYYESVTDHSTISVVFVKDGKIVKSISDYAESSPLDFQWAYKPLIYYSQLLELKPEIISPYLQFRTIWSFETKDKILDLTRAESYFLFNELKTGRELDLEFKEIYSLGIRESEIVNKIMTDGRYYKLYLKDKTTKTIDIGFDLLNNKNIVHQFKDKNNE